MDAPQGERELRRLWSTQKGNVRFFDARPGLGLNAEIRIISPTALSGLNEGVFEAPRDYSALVRRPKKNCGSSEASCPSG